MTDRKGKRPEGHTFTRAEIEAMPQDDLLANLDAINAQAASDGGIR